MNYTHFITKVWTICVVQAGFSKLCQLQSHVMVPLIQVSTDATTQAAYGMDLDSVSADVDHLLALIVEVASREYTPKLHGKGNTDFQLTRGLLGISM